jgi:hypothetical protein
MRTNIYFSSYLAQFFIECFRQKLQRKSKHILYLNFFSENRDVYEIMSKNMVEPDRSLMLIYYSARALRAR